MWHLCRVPGGLRGAEGGGGLGRTFLDAEAGGGDLVLDLPHRPPPLAVLPGRHPRVPPPAAHHEFQTLRAAPFVFAGAAGPPKASRSAGWSLEEGGTDGPASGRVASNLLLFLCKGAATRGPQLLELMFTEEVGGAAKREGGVQVH